MVLQTGLDDAVEPRFELCDRVGGHVALAQPDRLVLAAELGRLILDHPSDDSLRPVSRDPSASTLTMIGRASGVGARDAAQERSPPITLREHCQECGLRFEREEGYWVGALVINTTVVFGSFLVAIRRRDAGLLARGALGALGA